METNRLIIRHFKEEDIVSCYANFGQDETIGRYIITYPMRNIEEMERLVMSFVTNEDAWIMINKETLEPMGYITIDVPYRELRIGEIGYVIGEKFQRQGYAFEAITCVLREYFIKKNMFMIEAKYNETNISSEKLLKKLGFRIDGTLRNRRIDLKSGVRNDLIVCSITKDEFINS